MKKIFIGSAMILILIGLIGCGGGGEAGGGHWNGEGGVQITSIAVTPASSAVPEGVTKQLTAIATYSDGTSYDITESVTWSSGKDAVATINTSGRAMGVAAGTAVFTATSGNVSANATLIVTSAVLRSISVTPLNPSVVNGLTRQFEATGIFSDGTSHDITTLVTWSSADISVATLNPSGFLNSGLATGVAAGTSVITATSGSISGSKMLTVTAATLSSISVSPQNSIVPEGLTTQFTATGMYSDGISHDITTSVTWSSGTMGVAAVNAAGLAIGVAAGTSVITAASGNISDNTTLSVIAATLSSIAVTPFNPSVVAGLTRQFTATGTYSDGTSHDITTSVTWSSGDTAVAFVNPSEFANSGRATGIAPGTAVIKAALGSKSGNGTLTVTAATLSSIAVTPFNSSVAAGLTRQFTATGTYSDGTSHDITPLVTWSSGDIAVAIVNPSGFLNSGLATGVSSGTAGIKATLGNMSGNTTLTVTAATLSSIAVTPLNPSVVAGLTRQFAATGTYSDGTVADITALVTWSSGDIAVATVNLSGFLTSGFATGVSSGTAAIKATLGNISGNTTLTVTAATLSSIAVTPLNPSVVAGLTRQFAATGTYSDGTVADITALVTWSSGDIAVATVNASGFLTSGLAIGVASGTSVIKATSGSVSGNTTLTVTAATLSSIEVTPLNPSVAAGLTRQFAATGTYSDGTVTDITAFVVWSSGDITVAILNPSGFATSGRATGVAAGISVITATSGSVSGNTALTVTAALANNPTAPDLGETERFVILASQAVTTTAGSSITNGDIGIKDQARSYYAGFTPGAGPGEFVELTIGLSYAHDDIDPALIPAPYASTIAFLDQVRTDLGIAYTFLAADPNPSAPTQVSPIELGAQTLTRGVYKTASNVTIQTGDLTLDAEGDPDSIWIFSIGGTLATGAPGGDIKLIGGAQAKNVYWRTAGTTIIGTNTIFQGNVFAWPQVNVRTGADVTGRLFSVTEQVTLDANAVTKAP